MKRRAEDDLGGWLQGMGRKPLVLRGARQVGKTWLSREIMKNFTNPIYLNYDYLEDREIIKTASWLPDTDLVVLDEIHKMDGWKNHLKGIFDNKHDELKILQMDTQKQRGEINPSGIATITATEIRQARSEVSHIYMDEMLERYIVTLVNASRDPEPWWPEAKPWINYGASPRATLALGHCARALAYLRQRDFVEPADIIDLAYEALNHRIGLSFAARAEGITAKHFIDGLIERVPVP